MKLPYPDGKIRTVRELDEMIPFGWHELHAKMIKLKVFDINHLIEKLSNTEQGGEVNLDEVYLSKSRLLGIDIRNAAMELPDVVIPAKVYTDGYKSQFLGGEEYIYAALLMGLKSVKVQQVVRLPI